MRAENLAKPDQTFELSFSVSNRMSSDLSFQAIRERFQDSCYFKIKVTSTENGIYLCTGIGSFWQDGKNQGTKTD